MPTSDGQVNTVTFKKVKVSFMLANLIVSSQLEYHQELLDLVQQCFANDDIKQHTPSNDEGVLHEGEFTLDGLVDFLEWAEKQELSDITRNNLPNLFLYLPLEFEMPLSIISSEGTPTQEVMDHCEDPDCIYSVSELGSGVASSVFLQKSLEEIASKLPPELDFTKWHPDEEMEDVLTDKGDVLKMNHLSEQMMQVLHLYYTASVASQKGHAEIMIICDL